MLRRSSSDSLPSCTSQSNTLWRSSEAVPVSKANGLVNLAQRLGVLSSHPGQRHEAPVRQVSSIGGTDMLVRMVAVGQRPEGLIQYYKTRLQLLVAGHLPHVTGKLVDHDP